MSEFTGEIINIIEETHDVKTFVISCPNNFDFVPGQFCLVSFVDKPNLPTSKKPFTFSSCPKENDFVEITVKEIGTFTKAMFGLCVGDKLLIEGPRGESLNFDESIKEDVVFLAGGSGITPFISALRYAICKKLPNTFTLFFGNRKTEDIIYKEELELIAKEHKNIKIINILSCGENSKWCGECGYIDKEKILKYIENPKEKRWYACGPPPMMKSMDIILEKLKIPKEKIMIDKWQLPGKGENK